MYNYDDHDGYNDSYQPPEPKKKQIHFPLPWKKQTVKKKQQPVKVRKIKKKANWDDSTRADAFFDPELKRNMIKNEKYAYQQQTELEQQQDDEEDDKNYDQNVYNKVGKPVKSNKQDQRTKATQILEEKMEKDRKVYESYHTLSKIQELTDKELAKKRALVLSKQNKELEQLKYLIEQDDKQQIEKENEKMLQDRYQKVMQEKQKQLDLQQKKIELHKKQVDQLLEHQTQLDKQEPHPQPMDKIPPAEYVKGLIWEKDPRLDAQGAVDIHQKNQMADKEDNANKITIFQKRQKEINNQLDTQIQQLKREEAQRAREVNDLIELHKDQVSKEKEYQNRHFQAIEKRVNQLKNIIDPLEEKMRKDEEKELYGDNLLARTTGKMIQTYNEQITELLIEDLLLETVEILQEEEEKDRKKTITLKREAILNDYMDEFKLLEEEQEEIETRVQQKYQPFKFYDGPTRKQRQYLQEPLFARFVGLDLSAAQFVNILEKRNEFSDALFKLSHYSKKNLECFKIITEEIIEDILEDETRNLDKVNSEFAEAIFQNEFK